MKSKRILSLLMAFAMLITVAFSGISVAAEGETEPDDYDKLLAKWQYMTMGGDYDPEDPNMQGLLKSINDEAQDLLDRINYDAEPGWGDNDYLWPEYILGRRKDAYSDSNNTQFTIRNLKNMAIALQTKGCGLYKNEELKDAILYGLDYIYTHHFYPGVMGKTVDGEAVNYKGYGNWFTWQIGGPIYLCDATALMYEYLTPEKIEAYATVARTGTGNTVDTGANALWRNRVRMFAGILLKDSDLLTYVQGAVPAHMGYSTSGDGYHKDGTFIQHNNIVYNGGYGKEALSDISNFVYMLDGSPWEITDSRRENMYTFVRDHYAPFMYNGVFMDMVRGREITRKDTTDAYAGITISLGVLLIAEAAPEDVQQEFYGMIKQWMDNDYALATLNDASGVAWYMYPVYNLSKTLSIINDESIEKVNNNNTSYTFGYGARTVHVTDGFTFGISMNNPKISTFEQGDSNTKGWYTGLGMTYTYTNDIGRFTNVKPTINWYRLPGVTALENTTLGGHATPSGNFSGGTTLHDRYSVAGLDVTNAKSQVSARKSWFMFDDEVVALGTNITSTANKNAETTIENYLIKNDNAIVINGEEMPVDKGWKETIDADWAMIEGNVEGSNLGVYFPKTTALTALREDRSGKYTNLGSYNVDETVYTDTYATLYLNHGVKPENESYAYVLLPAKTQSQIENYAKSSDIEIIRQDNDIHAVYEKNLNTLGVNFWTNGVKSIDAMGTTSFLTVDKASTVMVTENNDSLDVAVTDTTKSEGKITVEINREAFGVNKTSANVEVIQTSPTIKFVVDGKGTVGNPVEVSFSYKPLATPDAPVITGAALDDDALTISYDAADRAFGYKVSYGTESGVYTDTVNVSGTSLTIRGLEANTTYYFAVKAYNDSGESAYSEEYTYSIGNTRILVDEYEDYSKMVSYSGGWAFDSGAPNRFNGDITRLKRNDADKTDLRRAENIVYYAPNPKSIELVTFEISGVAEADSTILEVLGSADQKTWAPITMDATVGATTADGWYPITYTNAGDIDSTVNYIKIIVSNNIKLWAPQLTKLTVEYAWTGDRVVTDTMLDDVRTYNIEGNFTMLTGDGEQFDGDKDLRVKGEGDASLIYSYTNIKNAALTAYLAKDSDGAVSILTSKDGVTYTEQEITPEITEGADYNKAVYSVSGLEEGTNYVKVTASGANGSVVLSNLDLDYTHVVAPIEQIRFVDDQYEAVMSYNEAPAIKLAPANAIGEIVYSSSNEDVAAVDSSTGVVAAVGFGQAEVTAAVLGTEISDTVIVRTSKDIAIGKTATASSIRSGYPIGNIVDGNMLSRWESNANPAVWAQVDLGKAMKFRVVELSWQQYPTEYTVELSKDGESWDTVYTETNGKGGKVWIDLGEEKEYRYIKMNGTNAQAAYSLWAIRALTFENAGSTEPELDNIALNKKTFASSIDGTNIASNAVDGKENTRFSTGRTANEWWYVDLGVRGVIEGVNILWEASYGKEYKIQVSDDAQNWTDIIHETNGAAGWMNHALDESVTARYVRMLGIERGNSKYGYSFYEFQVMGKELPKELVNVAVGKKATASSGDPNDASLRNPDLAIDGNDGTRFASGRTANEWWYVDLGESQEINKIRILWEGAYGKVYKIQVSDDAQNWTDIHHETAGHAGWIEHEITVPANGRYVRMLGIERGNSKYGYSFYEFEVLSYQEVKATEITSISFDDKPVHVLKRQSIQLNPITTPAEVNFASLVWESLNTDVATVDELGLVTGLTVGQAQIKVSSSVNPSVYAVCTVVVDDYAGLPVAAESVEIADKATIDGATVLAGTSIALDAVVGPQDATNKNVKWSSSDESVAVVTGDGTVTAVGMGEATITAASVVNADASDSVTIKVVGAFVDVEQKDYAMNEDITLTVQTPADVIQVGIMNENGKYLGKKNVSFVEENGIKTWTIVINVNSKGYRTFEIMTMVPGGEFTNAGASFGLNIGVPILDENAELTINSVRLNQESAQVNEVFTVTVMTSKAASKVGIFNESGTALGKLSSSYTDKGDVRVWTISLAIGTKGTRTLSFKAGDNDGNWTENSIVKTMAIYK